LLVRVFHGASPLRFPLPRPSHFPSSTAPCRGDGLATASLFAVKLCFSRDQHVWAWHFSFWACKRWSATDGTSRPLRLPQDGHEIQKMYQLRWRSKLSCISCGETTWNESTRRLWDKPKHNSASSGYKLSGSCEGFWFVHPQWWCHLFRMNVLIVHWQDAAAARRPEVTGDTLLWPANKSTYMATLEAPYRLTFYFLQ
jgi:hypothetical protein